MLHEEDAVPLREGRARAKQAREGSLVIVVGGMVRSMRQVKRRLSIV